MRVWVDLWEKYGKYYLGCCLFIILKIVYFKVNDKILWNAQNAPDRNIFIKKKYGGACPRAPLQEHESTSLQDYLPAWYVILSLSS